MRPLTEDETRIVFEKLHKFIGKNIKSLIDRPEEPYCLRLQKNRVYYVREDVMRRATNIARDKLVALGTCVGKFTHTGKFRLTIGSLDVLSQFAKYKVGAMMTAVTMVYCEPDDVKIQSSTRNPYVDSMNHSNTWTEGYVYYDGVWVKPSAEMSFLYGNHVLKNGLGRITENTPAYTGVVIYSMADVPLGFGVTAKSTGECRAAEPNAVVVFHQADVGEYLRNEDDL